MRILTAKDLMTHRVVTLEPDAKLQLAMERMHRKRVVGAPVVDADGALLGFLSEIDCLRAFRSDAFSWDDHFVTATVSDYMSRDVISVEPHTDIYTIAELFIEHAVRRFPVVSGGELIGIVSQGDVLRGIDKMRRELVPHAHYPDYPPDRIPTESHYKSHQPEEPPAHSSLRTHKPK